MTTIKAVVGWSALGLFGGSSSLFAIAYAIDEWQWRRLERKARRRP